MLAVMTVATLLYQFQYKHSYAKHDKVAMLPHLETSIATFNKSLQENFILALMNKFSPVSDLF